MAKSNLLSYADALARKGQATAANPRPRLNPARLWIDSRRDGASRKSARWLLCVAARILGYGKGDNDDWEGVPWWTLTYEDAKSLRGKLADKVTAGEYTAGMVNNVLYAVKSVMHEVWSISVSSGVDYITSDAWLLINDLPKIKGKKLRRDRYTPTDAEFARLIAHLEADTSPRGKRDRAIVGVSGQAGPRASELVALNLSDYDRDGKRLRIPQIKTETSEEDIWQPIEPPVTTWLDEWIAVRGLLHGPLFTRLERGGVGVLQRIAADGLTTAIIQRRGEEIGLPDLTTHSLRRYFVTRMLRSTGDLALTSSLVRHSSTVTTATFYDTRGVDDKRAAIKAAGLPGGKAEG